jgi:hypothetical protein
MKSCLGCCYADWKRSKNDALHPSGEGKCTFQVKIPQLPNSRYWIGQPCIGGGYINRKERFEKDCPFYKHLAG